MQKVLIKQPRPENRVCIITGDPIVWSGYGRPPLYSPRGLKMSVSKRRSDRRKQLQAEAAKLVKIGKAA